MADLKLLQESGREAGELKHRPAEEMGEAIQEENIAWGEICQVSHDVALGVSGAESTQHPTPCMIGHEQDEAL